MSSSNNFIQNIGKHYVKRSLVHSLACSAFPWNYKAERKIDSEELWEILDTV